MPRFDALGFLVGAPLAVDTRRSFRTYQFVCSETLVLQAVAMFDCHYEAFEEEFSHLSFLVNLTVDNLPWVWTKVCKVEKKYIYILVK